MSEKTRIETEQRALKLIKRGDQEGVAILYDQYAPVLYRVALQLLKSRSEAEDLVHDVFLEAWHKMAQYDAARGSIRSWLLTRTRSRALDRLRTAQVARRHARNEIAWVETQLLSEDASVTCVDGERAKQALQYLNRQQQQVVKLGYFEGLSCSEIATRCDIPLGTVKSRLSSGIEKLRRHLSATVEGI